MNLLLSHTGGPCLRTCPLRCLKTTHFIAKKTPLCGYLLFRLRHKN